MEHTIGVVRWRIGALGAEDEVTLCWLLQAVAQYM